MSFYTIKETSQAIFKEKNSKFIAVAFPISSLEEFNQNLQKLKKEYHDASHFCYALILNPDKSFWKINDDGEPNGTAGLPIYNQLLSFNLTNVALVVIRYFGGTKLGTSGLINAYKTAANLCLTNAIIIKKDVEFTKTITIDVNKMEQIMKLIKKHNLSLLKKEFINEYAQVSLTFIYPENLKNLFENY